MLSHLNLIPRIDLGDILMLLSIFNFDVSFCSVDFCWFRVVFMYKLVTIHAQFINENFLVISLHFNENFLVISTNFVKLC